MSPRPGVIFDIDGTLVDTNYLHILAWARVFAEAGIEGVPQADVHRRVGMAAGRMLEELVGPGKDHLKDAHGEQFSLLHKEIRPLPGARELLQAVHGRGGAVVLATSSKEGDVQALLDPLDAEQYIDELVHADDVEEA